jgi:hypothetical protein
MLRALRFRNNPAQVAPGAATLDDGALTALARVVSKLAAEGRNGLDVASSV